MIVCIKIISNETIKFYCSFERPQISHAKVGMRIRNVLESPREDITNIFLLKCAVIKCVSHGTNYKLNDDRCYMILTLYALHLAVLNNKYLQSTHCEPGTVLTVLLLI